MKITRRFALLAGAAALAGCAEKSKFRTYRGPEVTRLVVNKGEREMFLYHNRRVLKRYDVDLGFAPAGHKAFEGDGKTPEGEYHIDRRNPDSAFHLSLGVSYPNEQDISFARAHGKSPGGDIFIHGEPNLLGFLKPDWTAGCIAVTNREMEDVYAMVRTGTPITINA
ncbi:murein L,D-transpeptidase YafK [Roseovarius sp. MBR-79]|jgi:murein L,D-transpeptidase YafK